MKKRRKQERKEINKKKGFYWEKLRDIESYREREERSIERKRRKKYREKEKGRGKERVE